jgi:hypothetical protein
MRAFHEKRGNMGAARRGCAQADPEVSIMDFTIE